MPRKKADNPPSSCDADRLANELESLSRLIRDFSCKSPAGQPCDKSERVVALARLCRDLPVNEWQELATRPDFEQWLAFPLNGSAFPYLRHIQERLDTLAYQSEHDALTGLYNRRAFIRILEQEIQRTQREASYLSLAILDLDKFKLVNDTHGHPVGDDVLVGLARAMMSAKRTYDIASRMGGEEFAIVLPSTGPQRAKSMIERLLRLFRAEQFVGQEGARFSVTFSAGIASMHGRFKTTANTLIELADKALYQAKSQGRNTVVGMRVAEEIEYQRSTMVHSEEKKFLFFGSK